MFKVMSSKTFLQVYLNLTIIHWDASPKWLLNDCVKLIIKITQPSAVMRSFIAPQPCSKFLPFHKCLMSLLLSFERTNCPQILIYHSTLCLQMMTSIFWPWSSIRGGTLFGIACPSILLWMDVQEMLTISGGAWRTLKLGFLNVQFHFW